MKYVYKIVSAICALAVLPMLIFSEIIYYYLSSVAIQGLLGIAQLMGSDALQNAMGFVLLYMMSLVFEGTSFNSVTKHGLETRWIIASCYDCDSYFL